jgi:tetratricopeptide (TPR) repeat protein
MVGTLTKRCASGVPLAVAALFAASLLINATALAQAQVTPAAASVARSAANTQPPPPPPDTAALSFSLKADADTAMKTGEAAFEKGDYDEAIKNYQHAAELEPSNYFAILFVGDAYLAKKDFVSAGNWYTKAQQLDPNVETAFREHADMLTKQGDFAGARKLCLQAIVASPYDSKTWHELSEWAKPAHVTLQDVQIDVGTLPQRDKQGNINITIDPSQPRTVRAVWGLYLTTRGLWQEGRFARQFPHESKYRHSLAEEVDALTKAAALADRLKSDYGIKLDPDVQLLLKLYRANMLQPYTLLNAADDGIEKDYAAYRAQNRDKLIEYLGEFIVPESKRK